MRRGGCVESKVKGESERDWEKEGKERKKGKERRITWREGKENEK